MSFPYFSSLLHNGRARSSNEQRAATPHYAPHHLLGTVLGAQSTRGQPQSHQNKPQHTLHSLLVPDPHYIEFATTTIERVFKSTANLGYDGFGVPSIHVTTAVHGVLYARSPVISIVQELQ